MIVNPYARLLARLQFLWFILCLSIPAYFSASKTLKSAGIGLAWYHQVGLATLCLLLVAGVTMLLGVIMSATFRIVGLVLSAYGRRP